MPLQAQETLRPEIGKPLQAAQELIKAQRYKEALAKVREAEAVGARNANETFMIERMRIAAASGAGEVDTAARSFEALNGSARVSSADKVRMIESIAVGYYRAQQYAKSMQWSQRYFKEGGTNPAIRSMLIQSQYLSGDFAGASKELMAEITAAERAGQAPAEDRLKLLLNAATKQGDNNAYVFAMEKLVTYYPKKEYWVDLLSRMQRKPSFSDRLALDAFRLSLATGSMTKPADFMEMAQLALQADLPSESKQVVDKGFASNVLGTGPEAERHKRLRDLVAKRLAEDTASRGQDETNALAAKSGDALVAVGMNLVYSGQARQGRAADAAGHRQGRPEAGRGRQAAPRHRPAHRRRQGQGAGHLQDRPGHRRHRRPGAPLDAPRRRGAETQRLRKATPEGSAPPSRREGSEAGREQPCPGAEPR